MRRPTASRRSAGTSLGVAGHVHREAGQRVDERDVAGDVVGAAGPRHVVGRADADQHRGRALVTEVELDLLEGAFDEERRVRMHDRVHARSTRDHRRR